MNEQDSNASTDDLIEQCMPEIRAGVRKSLKAGRSLESLVVFIHGNARDLNVSITLRKTASFSSPDEKFNEAIKKALKLADMRLLVVVGLSTDRAVVWLDYAAFERSAS